MKMTIGIILGIIGTIPFAYIARDNIIEGRLEFYLLLIAIIFISGGMSAIVNKILDEPQG